MRWHGEERIREETEFTIRPPQVIYLVVCSVILSAAVFYAGHLMGRTGMEMRSAGAGRSPASHRARSDADRHALQSVVPSFSFQSLLSGHPEKQALDDVVLNALARLRAETLAKIEADEAAEKAELTDKFFPSPEGEVLSAAELEARGHGIGLPAGEGRREGPAPTGGAAVGTEGSGPDAGIQGQKLAPGGRGKPATKGGRAGGKGTAGKGTAGKGTGGAAGAGAPGPADGTKQARKGAGKGTGGAAAGGAAGPADGTKQARKGPTPRVFSVQAKSFQSHDEAVTYLKHLQKQLAKSRHKPYIMPVEIEGQKWYRVRIGRFKSKEEADRFKQKLEQKEGASFIIVTL